MCCKTLVLSIDYYLTEFTTKFNVISSTEMSYLILSRFEKKSKQDSLLASLFV